MFSVSTFCSFIIGRSVTTTGCSMKHCDYICSAYVTYLAPIKAPHNSFSRVLSITGGISLKKILTIYIHTYT